MILLFYRLTRESQSPIICAIDLSGLRLVAVRAKYMETYICGFLFLGRAHTVVAADGDIDICDLSFLQSYCRSRNCDLLSKFTDRPETLKFYVWESSRWGGQWPQFASSVALPRPRSNPREAKHPFLLECFPTKSGLIWESSRSSVRSTSRSRCNRKHL